MEDSGEKVSFGFAKKLLHSKLESKTQAGGDEVVEKDYVVNVDRVKGIEGTKKIKTKEKLVIPCSGNDLRLRPQDAQAVQELLTESRDFLAAQDSAGNISTVIQLKESDKEVLDKDLVGRAESSTMDDYDAVPIEGFGMGMLRGMGFKETEGIGGFRKVAVQCVEPEFRPKGLGLGAARKTDANGSAANNKDDGGEDLTLKKGSKVKIEAGQHRGLYGTVDGLDEDSARAVIRLSVKGDLVSVSENLLKVVGKAEFQKYAKVINRDLYDEYKGKQDMKESEWKQEKTKRDGQGERRSSRSGSKERSNGRSRSKDGANRRTKERSKRRSRSNSPAAQKRTRSPSARQRSGSNRSDNGPESKLSKVEGTWIRPHLRVRLIDEKYQGGKYFGQKVVVEDVVSQYSCVCRTESGRILDDVDSSKCETVIPRQSNQSSSVVMVVGRSHPRIRNRLGEIIDKDKRSGVAVVQLLPDKDEICKLSFDDICEFAGDPEGFY